MREKNVWQQLSYGALPLLPHLALPLPSSSTSLAPLPLPLASSGTCYNSRILAPRSPLSLATQKLRAFNLFSFNPLFTPFPEQRLSALHSFLIV